MVDLLSLAVQHVNCFDETAYRYDHDENILRTSWMKPRWQLLFGAIGLAHSALKAEALCVLVGFHPDNRHTASPAQQRA
jgi:hypothetical protein